MLRGSMPVTTTSAPPPPPVTIVEVVYPPARGTIGLRGSEAPLSWEATTPASSVNGDRHVFRLPIPMGVVVELKVVRDEGDWAGGRNYAVHAGDHLLIEPAFDHHAPVLVAGQRHEDVTFDVLLPPSYEEQESKRFPVLYMLDGQSLWSTSSDPFGVWNLEHEVARLTELGAIEELIVVGIHTSHERAERLSPVADPQHGGGGGQALLDWIVGALKPHVDERFRTHADRGRTAIMGSSMGGLFAFFAALSRSDVFGKAACLSSSFWWSDRWAARWVQAGKGDADEATRPLLYLDSGAALSATENDLSLRDGFHHTRSVFRALAQRGYEVGFDLHRFVWSGATHDAPSWAARVGIPLQLLFPTEPRRPRQDPASQRSR